VEAPDAVSDPTTIVDLLQTGGVLAMLVIVLWMLATRRFVFGWAYKEKADECEEWKGMALEGRDLAHGSNDIADAALTVDERLSRIETAIAELAGKKAGP
jgi:hypothetical protein